MRDDLMLALATLPIQRSTNDQLGRIRVLGEDGNNSGTGITFGGDGEAKPKDKGDGTPIVLIAGATAATIAEAALQTTIVVGWGCGIGKRFDGFANSDEGKACAKLADKPVIGQIFGGLDWLVGAAVWLGEGIGWLFGKLGDIDLTSDPLPPEPPKPPKPGPEMPVPPDPGGPNKPPNNDIPRPGTPGPKPRPRDVDTGPFFWNGDLAIDHSVDSPGRMNVKPDVKPEIPDKKPPPRPPALDIDFVVALCGDSAKIMGSHGMGVTEMLMVMQSESGINPAASNLKDGASPGPGTAVGINQMTIANIKEYEPGLYPTSDRETYDTYRSWSRTLQLATANKFFDANLRGLHIGNYSPTQRAAVLHYINFGGDAHTKIAGDFARVG